MEQEVFTPEIPKNGFKGIGIFPLDVSNVHINRILGAANQSTATSNEITDEIELFEVPVIDASDIPPKAKIKILEYVILSLALNETASLDTLATSKTNQLKSIENILQLAYQNGRTSIFRIQIL